MHTLVIPFSGITNVFSEFPSFFKKKNLVRCSNLLFDLKVELLIVVFALFNAAC